MRQIIQSLQSGEVSLVDVPTPMRKKGHVLIQTSKSLISLGTEKMLLEFGQSNWVGKARQQPDKVRQVFQKIKTDGLKPTLDAVRNKLDQPIPLGYCNVGRVLAVDESCKEFMVGDRVLSNGNHAEIVSIAENLCAKIPDQVDDETATFTVVSSIGLEGVRLLNPTLGETVVVLGLGLIGLLSVQILRANGCRVIGFDFDEKKVNMARSFGAEAFCLDDEFDSVGCVLSLTQHIGADGVLITASTSNRRPVEDAPRMCRVRGRVVLVGTADLQLSRDDFYKKEISFQVSCSYGPGRYDNNYEKKGLDYPIGYVRWTEKRNFEAILALMAKGQIKTESLISDRIPVGRVPDLYSGLTEMKDALGLVLEYPSSCDKARKVTRVSSPKIYSPAIPVVGVIGSGGFAQSTILPLLKKHGVRLKSIASASGLTSYHAGNKFGFEMLTSDPEVIFDDSEINAVFVLTPHNSHSSLVKKCLLSGKNVFVEKPLAIRDTELDELRQLYIEKSNLPLLMVGFNRRFSNLVDSIKIGLEKLSEPAAFVMTVNAGAIPSDHWIQDPDVGGGRLVGEGCHFVDLIRYLANSTISDGGVYSLDTPTRDSFSIQLKFENGSSGTVHYFANGNKSFPKERLEVFCGGTIFSLDNFKSLQTITPTRTRRKKLFAQDKGHRAEIEAFLSAIKDGGPSPISASELFEVSEWTIRLNRGLYE